MERSVRWGWGLGWGWGVKPKPKPENQKEGKKKLFRKQNRYSTFPRLLRMADYSTIWLPPLGCISPSPWPPPPSPSYLSFIHSFRMFWGWISRIFSGDWKTRDSTWMVIGWSASWMMAIIDPIRHFIKYFLKKTLWERISERWSKVEKKNITEDRPVSVNCVNFSINPTELCWWRPVKNL